jgi:hypothetical protein
MQLKPFRTCHPHLLDIRLLSAAQSQVAKTSAEVSEIPIVIADAALDCSSQDLARRQQQKTCSAVALVGTVNIDGRVTPVTLNRDSRSICGDEGMNEDPDRVGRALSTRTYTDVMVPEHSRCPPCIRGQIFDMQPNDQLVLSCPLPD